MSGRVAGIGRSASATSLDSSATSFDPPTGGQFFTALTGRVGQLSAALKSPLAVIRAALTGGFGQLGAAFAHRLRQLVATLPGALACGFDVGCALFPGGAGEFDAAFAGGLDQR